MLRQFAHYDIVHYGTVRRIIFFSWTALLVITRRISVEEYMAILDEWISKSRNVTPQWERIFGGSLGIPVVGQSKSALSSFLAQTPREWSNDPHSYPINSCLLDRLESSNQPLDFNSSNPLPSSFRIKSVMARWKFICNIPMDNLHRIEINDK